MLEMTLATKFEPGTNLSGDKACADWRYLLPNMNIEGVLFLGVPSVNEISVFASVCRIVYVCAEESVLFRSLRDALASGNLGNVTFIVSDQVPRLSTGRVMVDVIHIRGTWLNNGLVFQKNSIDILDGWLKPEGVVYWESVTLGGRALLNRRKRALESNGYGVIQGFWLTPFTTGRYQTAIPHGRRDIAKYFFGHVLFGRSKKMRLVSRIGEALSTVGAHSFAVPRCGVRAVKSRALAHVDSPPEFLTTMAENASLDFTNCSFGLSARGDGNSNKIIYYIFEKKKKLPFAVVKMTRAAEFNYRLENEYRVLDELNARSIVEERSYPQVLFFGQHNGLSVLCQKAMHGRPFRVRTEATAGCPLAHDAIQWLMRLGIRSENGSTTGREVADALATLLKRFNDIYQLSQVERDFLHRQIGAIADSSESFPLVFQHGDPGTWNMLVSDKNEVIVIDWEAGEPQGMPLWDLFYFIRTYASWVSRVKGLRDPIENFASHFFHSSPLRTTLKVNLDQYNQKNNFDSALIRPMFYSCWMHRALKESARLKESQLQKGNYIQLIRRLIQEEKSGSLSYILNA